MQMLNCRSRLKRVSSSREKLRGLIKRYRKMILLLELWRKKMRCSRKMARVRPKLSWVCRLT